MKNGIIQVILGAIVLLISLTRLAHYVGMHDRGSQQVFMWIGVALVAAGALRVGNARRPKD